MDGESMVNIIEFDDDKSPQSPSKLNQAKDADTSAPLLTPNRVKEPFDKNGQFAAKPKRQKNPAYLSML